MNPLTVATDTVFRGIPGDMPKTGKSKAQKNERDERLRDLLKELRATRYKTTAALARALQFTPPAITEAINGNRGIGLDLLAAIADLTGRTTDELMGRTPRGEQRGLADLPAWPAARAAAEKRLQHLRPDLAAAALDRVATFAIPGEPILLTGYFVARLAEAVAEKPQEF